MKENKPISKLEQIAIRLTESVGSVSSLIIHSIAFVAIFSLLFFGVGLDNILLILTTAVSLEAIYLAIFIQMTVNRNTESLEAVEEDIEEIQEDVDGIQEDVQELEKDVDEIEKDVDEITEDISEDDVTDKKQAATLEGIERSLMKIVEEIERLKKDR
jgi:septal ring factor EnvC (AmiA/AmiB activator)